MDMTLAPPLTQDYSVRLHLLIESASCVAYRLCKSTKGQGVFEKKMLYTLVKKLGRCCFSPFISINSHLHVSMTQG
ncbi:hypothetical protein BO85DRAFT_446919 [Aspergillus piperis CBS 112811]|uniref:Uncharacterized protein n=1 Tax=Aspergillus piperis CBS 112811 TaxID=1448313 RepID=A0A8G1R703_9EURO|nr:hypothetical protein BO85DRAFT_446919 [Aspergillus piperis CBS 112811]RAH60362.1 hypothetical protein BO85DRAFT_446919 [Aspergillus piperis CBS 112811]